MISRFSKKSVIIFTNSIETGDDFKIFQIEDIISFAINNDISLYFVSFNDGGLTEIYRHIAEKTGGQYLRAHRSNSIHTLINDIEKTKINEIIFSYKSASVSRFGDEPISVIVEINYSGMTGVGKSIYYPMNVIVPE